MVKTKDLKWHRTKKGMKANIIRVPTGYELADVVEIKSPKGAKRKGSLLLVTLKKRLGKVV